MSCTYQNRCWYAYISGNPLLASSYSKATMKPECFTGCCICAIYVPACGTVPMALSGNMRQYVTNALITCRSQPPVPPSCKYFVYMKSC
jgi:hypothetical protein